MPPYQIIKFEQQVGAGVSMPWWASVRAVLKENSGSAPYCVANEIICSQLGQFLGLPVPPCGVFLDPRLSPRPPWFGSLNFNVRGLTFPPADPRECVAAYSDPTNPRLDVVTGVLLFDVWIANGDRHPRNLVLDTTVTPAQLHVFDHSHALLGREARRGASRLGRLRNELGIAEGTDPTGAPHCLLDTVRTNARFGAWLRRIQQVPDYVITDAIDRAREVNQITSDEAGHAVNFLQYRRSNLAGIISANRFRFTGIPDTNWSTL